jgi:hypothetical protein
MIADQETGKFLFHRKGREGRKEKVGKIIPSQYHDCAL